MTPAEENVVTVAVWNVEHNGHDRNGTDERRHRAYDVLAEYQPDLVFRQELTHAPLDGSRALYEEANRLGLWPFMAPGTPESPNPTGVFLSTELFQVDALYTHATGGWHPICNPLVRLKDPDGRPSGKALSLASVHLCCYDPATRAREAKRLVTLGAPGRTALFGGDMNSYPHRTHEESVPLPDWSDPALRDAAHFEHRTVERDGKRVSDTVPDQILAGGRQVFVEAGYYAATTLGHAHALEPTANLWRKDQGRRSRIDRLYFSPSLAPALLSLDVVADDDVAEVSDHALLIARFDRAAMQTALTPVSETPEESRA
ncbi:endonuclease/exonuclease/phosphatase family protein [Streptomyces niveus]|uniref:endonuclease/exonuclease/phosphatase family protein n=1 Tax=Streptomyces niveus TaxID=193462 RepID=UPI00364C7EA3